jgi:hypothetical protein
VNIDNFVIEPHLALTLKKYVYLVDFRVAVPVTSLLAWFIGGGGDTNNVSVEFMVNDSSASAGGGGHKTAKVITPGIQGSNVCHAVVAHGP